MSERHLSGIKNYSRGMEERELALTTWGISSSVVARLCDQARGQNSAVTCFYFDFTDRKEQSATSSLGSLLRQLAGGLERIPEQRSRSFRDGRNAIGGQGRRLPDITKMLPAITSSLPTFVRIDALGECAVLDCVRVPNSPTGQVLRTGPDGRSTLV